jgi:hypothetical protein
MAYRQGGLADPGQYDKDKVKGAEKECETPNAPRNPQMVENIQDQDWKVRFDALGLKVPGSLSTPGSDERKLVEWWQAQALESGEAGTLTGAMLLAGSPLKNDDLLESALKKLMVDGVVRVNAENRTLGRYQGLGYAGVANRHFGNLREAEFILREDYIPRNKEKFEEALALSKGSDEQAPDDSKYQRMAAAVTYGDYLEFMNSGFIQKATNALHDTFCASGLTVIAGEGGEAFKVYGDDAMFSQESAKGVKHSGETSNLSRDAIMNLINTGDDGGKSAASIVARLPDKVRYQVKAEGSTVKTVEDDLETWHNSTKKGALQDRCNTEVFPGMSWSLMQKFIPGVIGSELGNISKDKVTHGSDAF